MKRPRATRMQSITTGVLFATCAAHLGEFDTAGMWELEREKSTVVIKLRSGLKKALPHARCDLDPYEDSYFARCGGHPFDGHTVDARPAQMAFQCIVTGKWDIHTIRTIQDLQKLLLQFFPTTNPEDVELARQEWLIEEAKNELERERAESAKNRKQELCDKVQQAVLGRQHLLRGIVIAILQDVFPLAAFEEVPSVIELMREKCKKVRGCTKYASYVVIPDSIFWAGLRGGVGRRLQFSAEGD